jgi:hypothetical protein
VAGSQADLVARAGSDTIYFNTDKYELDDCQPRDSWTRRPPGSPLTAPSG